MTVKSAPYYWLECDHCGTPADYGDYSAMADEGDAIEYALESDWTTDGGKYNCRNCPSLAKCEECGEPAGEEWLERDELCQQCWDKQEAGVSS